MNISRPSETMILCFILALNVAAKISSGVMGFMPQQQRVVRKTLKHNGQVRRQQHRSSILFMTQVHENRELMQQLYDDKYYSPPDQTVTRYNSPNNSQITLTRFLSNVVKDNPKLKENQSLLLAVQMACKTISNLVNRAGLAYSIQNDDRDDNDESSGGGGGGGAVGAAMGTSTEYSDGRFYSMKRLDKISTTVLKNALKFTGKVRTIAPQAKMDSEVPQDHQPGVLIASALDSNYVACFDPLDGSGNADASICTGTVFGVFEKKNKEDGSDSRNDDEDQLLDAVLQPGKKMRMAGYCLYSSATVLVFTLKDGVYGFTLDPQTQEFVLTHDNLTIPKRGNVYSCNEANSEGWVNENWKSYLKRLKLGQGETKTKYAHRYVGSMVGDIHRTLLYGGIFAYPSDTLQHPEGNLQLSYKSAPMAFLVHRAGGKALDESGSDLLDKKPDRIHQKSPCFMGSPDDVDELKSFLTKSSS